MVYQIPDLTKAAAVAPFDITLPDGRAFQLRSYNLLSAAEINRMAAAARRDDLTPLITAMAGDSTDLADALWNLPLRAVTDLYVAWQKAGGVTTGESKSSSFS